MGRICIKACCFISVIIHIIWSAALVALTSILQSDVVSKNIGFIPTIYDLIFLWVYNIGLFITGITIFCCLVWKRQRLLSLTIILFLFLQSMAFACVIVMLTMDRFKNTGFGPIVESALRATPDFIIAIIAGIHCVGTFIYVILLTFCIHKLNDKYSPYWK